MTAQTYQTPAPLVTYLRRATFGLPRDRREEVGNELEEHILCRAEGLEFQGHSAEQALAQALREMGPPLRVSLGMNGVHNMPKLIAFGTLGMLAVSAGLYALAGGGGQVITLPVLTHGPKQICVEKTKPQPHLTLVSVQPYFNCYQDDRITREGVYVSMSTAKKTYQAVGQTLELEPEGQYRLSSEVGYTTFGPDFHQQGEDYISAESLLYTLIKFQPKSAKRAMSLSGYRQPAVNIGNLTFQLDQSSTFPIGPQLYDNLTDFVIDQIIYGADRTHSFEMFTWALTDQPHTVQTKLNADEAVMVVARIGLDRFKVAIAPVGHQGQLTFKYSSQTLKFVDQADQLKPAENGVLSVLVVRLTNTPLQNLKSGIFLPKQ